MMAASTTAAMMIHIAVRRVVTETMFTTSELWVPAPGGNHAGPADPASARLIVSIQPVPNLIVGVRWAGYLAVTRFRSVWVVAEPDFVCGVLGQAGQCLGHRCGVESVGVEVGGIVESQPLQPVLVFRVVGIVEGLHKLGVAPDAAAVLRRGGASPTGAARIGRRLVAVEDLLNQDVVFPVVAEVVGVAQLAVHRRGVLLQRHRRLSAVSQVGGGGAE